MAPPSFVKTTNYRLPASNVRVSFGPGSSHSRHGLGCGIVQQCVALRASGRDLSPVRGVRKCVDDKIAWSSTVLARAPGPSERLAPGCIARLGEIESRRPPPGFEAKKFRLRESPRQLIPSRSPIRHSPGKLLTAAGFRPGQFFMSYRLIVFFFRFPHGALLQGVRRSRSGESAH